MFLGGHTSFLTKVQFGVLKKVANQQEGANIDKETLTQAKGRTGIQLKASLVDSYIS